MLTGLRLGGELKRFKKTKLGRIALGAVVLLPLLYSVLYLWAFWDPFGHVNKLPVAFVNDDEGTVYKGEEIHAGDQVVDALKKQDQIHFDFVSNQDAVDGVKDGKYYFMVRLTPEFSTAATSSAGTNATQAVIQANYNSANGYLSTLIGENTMRTLVPTISATLGDQVINKVLVGIQDAGAGMATAATGADQLHAGAKELHAGLGTALDGAGQIDTNMQKIADGAAQLHAGTTQLRTAADTAIDTITPYAGNIQQFARDITALGATTSDLSATLGQVQGLAATASGVQSGGADTARGIAAQLRAAGNPALADQLDALATRLDTQGLGKNSAQLATLNTLAQGTKELSNQLADPTSPLSTTLATLQDSAGVQEKLTTLKSSVHQLDDGAGQLEQGAAQLRAEGTIPLTEGLTKLNDGAGQLEDGAKKLSDGLGDGARQVPQWSTLQRENSASVMSNPATLTASDNAGEQSFGSGLAPFFFSLAMCIGGLITFLLLRPINNRAIASGVSPLRAALDGLLPGAVVGALQASAIVALTMLVLPIHVAHPVGLWLFAMAASIMFVALNQMLNVLLGAGPGKVASMALLMLQILASGGLYPVETEPRLFSWLHPFNPWTYTVNGFRQLIYGNLDERLPQAILALVVVGAICVTLTSMGARRDRLWSIKRLHPPIDV